MRSSTPEVLKKVVESKIKNVFFTSLRTIELAFGTDFDEYEKMRSEILRVGNNSIREIKELINAEFGIEEAPEQVKVKFTNNKEKANG